MNEPEHATAITLRALEGEPLKHDVIRNMVCATAEAIAERQDRLLVFPGRAGAAVGTPVRLRDGQVGDWYLDESIEASPISGLLAGLAVDDVPPLTVLFDAEGRTTWTPLRARRDPARAYRFSRAHGRRKRPTGIE